MEDDAELEGPVRKIALTDTSFWADPTSWPHDPPEYFFLARAFNEIGKAMFEPEWTGNECSSRFGDTDPGLARLISVREKIAKSCQRGDLILAIRSKQTGEMIQAPSHWWNTEPSQHRRRFWRCQMDPEHPLGGSKAVDESWIYVTRKSLDAYVRGQTVMLPNALTEDVHLSPYLKLMIAVIRKMGITADMQPPKDAVEAEIESAWPRFIKGGWQQGKFSPKLAKTMATLIREPESQLGRAKK